MKFKILAIGVALTLATSISVSANELSNSNFQKYREKLLEMGHTQEEVLEIENEYNMSNRSRSESEVDLLLTEYIEGKEKYKDADINSKPVIAKPIQTRAISFSAVEPGDIIFEPDRAVGFGHTSVVWTDTRYVVEALSGKVSSLNSTMEKWNDTTSRQRWCWIPSYSANTRKAAALYGGKYLNKPYSLLATKLSTSSFYCSLLNWRQYYDAGKDIDRNGGVMVLPEDIYYNDLVQVYLSQG